MDKRLNNKVAIVTGGGAGIGEAISKKFALHGAKVVVCGLPDDPVDSVVQEIKSKGGEAVAFKADITVASNAHACVQRAVDTYGKLDILINNAGVFPAVGYIQEWPLDKLDYLIRNNIYSAVMMTHAAVPQLKKSKGCIVNAGSEAGIDGDAQNAPYAGTKGFIHAFTRSVAAEQAQNGIRANVVCPGPIDTAWTHDESSPMTVKMEKLFIEATPMGRRGTTEEVANVYLFLASDEASYVTGALYPVDGGITISKGPMGSMADSSMKKEPKGELDLKHEHDGDSLRHLGKSRPAASYSGAHSQPVTSSQGKASNGGLDWGTLLTGAGVALVAGLAAYATRQYQSGQTDGNSTVESTTDATPMAEAAVPAATVAPVLEGNVPVEHTTTDIPAPATEIRGNIPFLNE